jgi:hypothetical protein
MDWKVVQLSYYKDIYIEGISHSRKVFSQDSCTLGGSLYIPTCDLSNVRLEFYLYTDLFVHTVYSRGPPLWSSGQSSWLQIRRPGFDSRHYQKKKEKVVGLERGPLRLVSTTEELLGRKVAVPV